MNSTRIIYKKIDVSIDCDVNDLPPIIAKAIKNKPKEVEDPNIKLLEKYMNDDGLSEDIKIFFKSQIEKLKTQPKIDPNEVLIKDFIDKNKNFSIEKIDGGFSINNKF